MIHFAEARNNGQAGIQFKGGGRLSVNQINIVGFHQVLQARRQSPVSEYWRSRQRLTGGGVIPYQLNQKEATIPETAAARAKEPFAIPAS